MAEEKTQEQQPEDTHSLKELLNLLGQNPTRLLELFRSEDRNEAITRLCLLDNSLEELLRAVMIQDRCVDDLMNDGQELQSFSSKRRLAYAV